VRKGRDFSREFSAWLVAAAVLCVSTSAGAFCRTTTSPPSPGYNPAADDAGCWSQGKPIAWTAGSVPYGVSRAASAQVTLAEATRIADLAFAAWNSALCTGGSPSAQAYDVGPLDVMPNSSDCTTTSTCNASTHDVIVFRDAAWPYANPVNTLALTTVTYGVNDGEIFEAYTEVNTAEHTVSTEEPPPSGTFDLQAILTHEAGHFLGLAHATDTHPVMYAFYKPGAITLTPDDVDAICSVYAPDPPGSSCQAARAGGRGSSSGDATAAVGPLLLGVSVLAWGTRRWRGRARR
jgi:hypothetical protein